MINRMNTLTLQSALLAIALAFSGFASAEPHHEIETPNGGRLVTSVEPHCEVLVAEDGQVKITFLDDSGAMVPHSSQEVSLTAGDRMNPVKLSFEERDGVLVSDGKLAMGKTIPVILQIKSAELSNSARERFNLNMSECPTCDNKEYACSCHD
ncbi:hypothetical protein [Pelagicoccus albus]|uniref:Uncharacterized protein n=1 Tax=Pelagicoccus albus TaxID=415222 RepID=A0A7X1B5V9_9BACT|nr:hypothetical protein [Pelagicoccus albus]MBC2605113.1 hypothetical protein [Pelagicoccus albus]